MILRYACSCLLGIFCILGCSITQEKDERPSSIPSSIDDLWDFDDPAESRARFEKALHEIGDDGPLGDRLEILTQIARTYGLEGNFAESLRILDGVEGKLGGASPLIRIRTLLEKGRTFNSSKKSDRARPLFLKAWDLARESGEHGYAVDAAHMMGIIEQGDESLLWNERAIAYAEESRDARALRWLGSLYNNTGWTYHDSGRYEEALALWRKALAWHEERDPGKRTLIAKYMVGRGLRSLERFDEALRVQQDLLAEMEAKGARSDGFVFEEIGECLLALGRAEESKGNFSQAYDLLSKDSHLAREEPKRLKRLEKLAGTRPEDR
ncbi:MAG: tetratricopeptide repeat protein [Planctomycetota bacterium]|nr:tetratricopeptide repeat protein [Planctomycetota bacterium]